MILLIDNYDSFTHNLYQYLAQLTEEPIQVVRNDEITLEEITRRAPSRIVISPGPGRPAGAGISVEVIRRYAGRIPLLGVCLGHQAIGEAFGGRTISARRVVHGKTDRIVVDGKGLFRSIDSPAEFVRYHSLAIDPERLPPELEVTAWSEDGEIMGVRHREYVLEGVQFHPESIGSESGLKVLANFLNYRREPFKPRKTLERVIAGEHLSLAEASEFMEEVTDGNLGNAQIAGFLVALNAKGITPEEIAGCARVLQRKRVPLPVDRPLLDTCGTGGDGLGTFNISSLTALAAASCGAVVAKHGNRAVSSRSGSADFYRALGIGIEITPDQARQALEKTGFAFLYAPLYHGGMRFAGPARKELGIKTIMNLLGPLANPGGAEYQLIGVFSEEYLHPVARAAVLLGGRRGMVVHGLDGQDEISVCAPTRVVSFSVDQNAADHGAVEQHTASEDLLERTRFEEFVIQPDNYGLSTHKPELLVGGDPRENAEMAIRLLQGESDPVLDALHDAVALNAGAALAIYGVVQTIAEGVAMASQALKEGRVAQTLASVIEATT
ncbi:bifunctional glutamine amidotransferase/anthranilate phosphoribosyltransferase [Alkalispirochaeta sphaeroplastigenens]|uniref:Anthranilate phosphoribosyltransferase n=1 Tax=Alkalispirochaeta sphaeroplastigenens TaxID=1187066 RepID=A0A2S4JX47_9SPIO|nr:bifunctional anthranilate synthase component II/anthranilate phosphoribosyltransferase [Alkalispirochaeta sphaeroplastigenens]POR04081.1 bifunctional glutamine amidotransferase/anthranilate phosphoribosyltransferase [Alkalispirochaeta sphaeroplastigenens]